MPSGQGLNTAAVIGWAILTVALIVWAVRL
jgi:hypothetical protein